MKYFKKLHLYIFLFISAILVIFTCGCSIQKEIESVSVNDETYTPVYLYTYSNAELSPNAELSDEVFLSYEVEQAFQSLDKTGYFLSTRKYELGETIKVDFSCFYGEDGLTLSYGDREKYARKQVHITVTNLEKKGISVKEKKDTYIISYSELGSPSYDVNYNRYDSRKYCCLSQNKDLLNDLVVTREIETVKENVLISYET